MSETRRKSSPLDVIVLESSDARFVVAVGDIMSFELATARPSWVSADGVTTVDLADHLGGSRAAPGQAVITIVTAVGGRVVRFKTGGSLRLARPDRHDFYRLPSELAQTRCHAWVCGVALLDAEADGGDAEDRQPAIWIDLRRLAALVSRKEVLDAQKLRLTDSIGGQGG